jgi:hypothetical protein
VSYGHEAGDCRHWRYAVCRLVIESDLFFCLKKDWIIIFEIGCNKDSNSTLAAASLRETLETHVESQGRPTKSLPLLLDVEY